MFFSRLIKNFGKNCKFRVSWKNDFITGASFMLMKNGILYMDSIGVDKALSGNDMTYFNLGYYSPIRDAMSSGIKKINFGAGLHKMKMQRGCRIGNLYVYYKVSNRIYNLMLKFFFYFINKWYGKKFS